jgi:iron complex transport system ATP-binding protein
VEARIQLRDGAFSYGKHSVFRGLDLEVAPGEVLCLLGPNGCGKTTLLRCLSGALSLQHGTLRLKGRDISSYGANELARNVGYVFQEHTAVFPFSVLDVVCMGRAPYLGRFASPSARDRLLAEAALEQVGMRHVQGEPYTELSGGERQLILIARTLAQGPEVILLDEPTSHLDFKNQALCLELISRLAGQGISLIVTTHNPNHVLLFPDTVAMMNGGRFVAVGKASEVISRETLSATYGIDVGVFAVPDPNGKGELKLVSPRFKPRTGA